MRIAVHASTWLFVTCGCSWLFTNNNNSSNSNNWAVAGFAFMVMAPRPRSSPPPRHAGIDSSTALHLFAFRGNDNNSNNNLNGSDKTSIATKLDNSNSNKNNHTTDGPSSSVSSSPVNDMHYSDLNGWINGLRQWPLYPGRPSQTATRTTATLLEETAPESSSKTSSEPEGKTNTTDDIDDDDDDDGDLNGWIINSLRQWPLLSRTSAASASSSSVAAAAAATTTADAFNNNEQQQQQQQALSGDSNLNNSTTMSNPNNNNKDDDSSKTTTTDATTSSFPLTRILNMEALLAFAMQKSNEGTTTTTPAAPTIDAIVIPQQQEEEPSLPLLETLWQASTTTADELLSTLSATVTSTTETEDLVVHNITTAATNTAATTSAITQPKTTTTIPWWQKPFVSFMGEQPQEEQQQQLVLISPSQIQTLIKDATSVANMGVTNLGKVAQQMATERGWDVQESVARAADTTRFARKLVSTANGLLRVGYVRKNKRHYPKQQQQRQTINANMTMPAAVILKNTTTTTTTTATSSERALFDDFASATELDRATSELQYDAQMGALAGAIYEETIPKTHALGHTIVARGMTSQVEWMVTDSLVDVMKNDDVSDSSVVGAFGVDDARENTKTSPRMIRTLTIRGFDASDERVDREELLNQICTATPECLTLGEDNDNEDDDDDEEELASAKSAATPITKVLLHTGLRKIAKAIYKDVAKQYLVDWTCPQHKIALCGHSVGGSLSLLVLLEMVMDQGEEYVLDKVQRVYTFGSPPVAVVAQPGAAGGETNAGQCDILTAFGLPTSLVHAYVQPWDPIVRLFTKIDPFYPLVSDMGADGVTPWINGPPRTLRPIIRQIAQAWEGWPRFRDTFRDSVSQNYTTVGTPHLLLPEPTRYLADRFVSVNIPTPSTDAVVRLAPNELHAALESLFPLDVFEVSYVPQAIRSFVHHFYPSYEDTLVDYVRRLKEESQEVRSPSTEQRKQGGKSRQSAAREKRKKNPPAAAFQVE